MNKENNEVRPGSAGLNIATRDSGAKKSVFRLVQQALSQDFLLISTNKILYADPAERETPVDTLRSRKVKEE